MTTAATATSKYSVIGLQADAPYSIAEQLRKVLNDNAAKGLAPTQITNSVAAVPAGQNGPVPVFFSIVTLEESLDPAHEYDVKSHAYDIRTAHALQGSLDKMTGEGWTLLRADNMTAVVAGAYGPSPQIFSLAVFKRQI